MQEVTKKVRTKGKVVSEITVPVYATVEEIVSSEPAERIVAVFNNGNHVRLMGNERAKFGGAKTGKKKRMQMAFNLITTDELMSVSNDMAALEALLMSDEVQSRVDAKLAETGETIADD
jgi:hypothetical protein